MALWLREADLFAAFENGIIYWFDLIKNNPIHSLKIHNDPSRFFRKTVAMN